MLLRRVRQRIEGGLSRWSAPFSLLSVRSDEGGWVLDQEAVEIAALARSLGIRAGVNRGLDLHAPQCWHYTSQFALGGPAFPRAARVSVDFLHGDPADPAFRAIHAGLQSRRDAVARVRVSHSRMESLALESGIAAARVHRIPLAVRVDFFPLQTAESRRRARAAFGLPQDAAVIGSFQKDGVGWGDGREPKLVKGPDVFLSTIGALRDKVRGLHVLLTGPARGYVRAGLDELKVPFRHVTVARYADMGPCFDALDAYVISSRDEGGPKAVLEAMAAGVPLVTTRVGQAVDLVRHRENGWITDVEDAEGLAHWTAHAVSDRAARTEVVKAGRKTAEENSYEAQRPLWAGFFRGYVEGW